MNTPGAGKFRVVCAVLVATLGMTAQAKPSLLVGNIQDSSKAKPLKAKDTREWLEAALVTAIRQAAGKKYKITTMGDMVKQLEFQSLREGMGCDNEGCLAEIAGMTGAEFLVFPKLMQAGKTYAFQLTLIQQAKAEVVKASTPNRFQWSTESCEAAIHGAVGEVFLGKEPGTYRPPATGTAAGGVSEESQQAFTRLSEKASNMDYRGLLTVAREVAKKDLPKYGTMDIKEYAMYSIYMAHNSLKEYDAAYKAAEQYLATFDKGTYHQTVRMGLKELKRQQRQRDRGKVKADKELVRIEAERKKAGSKVDPIVAAGYDFQRCTTMLQHRQHAGTVKECGNFVKKFKGNKNEAIRQFYLTAWWSQIQAVAELGRFKEARKMAAKLIAAEPEYADQSMVETLIESWPAD